jgi:hypothetical protein
VKELPAPIRAFDVEGRNQFFERTRFFSRQAECNQQLSTTMQSASIGTDAKRIVDRLTVANARRDTIGASDPRTINSFESDTALNEKQWAMNEGIPEILRLAGDSGPCVDFWNLSRAFWIHRNNAMVRNIRAIAGEFSGRRLIVLTGFEHRYYLRSHLYDWTDQPGYVLREYWEF